MILICEAEHELAGIYRTMLERDGHTCVIAHSRHEGLAALRRHGPALRGMVVDYRLPDGVGLDIVHQARATRPEIFCVMVSGFHDIPVPDGAAFLPKPFLPSRLRELMSTLIRPPDTGSDHADALGGDSTHQH